MDKKSIAFIGGGNMARCLVGGLINDNYPAKRITVADIHEEPLARIRRECGDVQTCSDNCQAVAGADVLVIAVKPQLVRSVLTDLCTAMQERCPLVLSIAAGIRTATLQQWLGSDVPIVRAMPNTPALVASGATGLYANAAVSAEQRDLAEAIMRAVGLTVWVDDEALIDAITALSGSGPAYFFLFMEALQQVGVEMGLAPDVAQLLTIQTAFGAAKMALESDLGPPELRAQVTSPGGTTERAVKTFQELGLSELVRKAAFAARTRAEEMAHSFGEP